MSKFIEVLHTGLTVQGRVCISGQRVQVRDEFPMQSKKKQAARWGAPRYRQITRADFEASGGAVLGGEEEPAAEPAEPTTTTTETVPEDKFARFAELNVEDTLQAAAELTEEALAEFVLWEQAGQARKGVLGPLGAGGEATQAE